ncbi:MAG: TolC family protein [Myxococcota bacterium]
MTTFIRFFSLLITAWTPPARADDDAVEPLIERAVDANPSLLDLRAQTQSLRELAAVAGTWTDPIISVEYANVPPDSLSLSESAMSGLQLRVQQTLPSPGQNALQREVAALDAEQHALQVQEAELQLQVAIRKTWWMLAQTAQLQAVTRQHLDRTRELLSAAQARYETGATGQHAVLRLTVLADRLRDDLGDFDTARLQLSAMLDESTGQKPGSTVAVPDTVTPLPPPPGADWGQLAQDHRPALQALQVRQDVAARQAALARADKRPDVTIWGGYRIRAAAAVPGGDVDLVSAGISVPVPAGSARRADGQQAAAQQQGRAASAQTDAMMLQILAGVHSHRAAWQRAWDKANTYDETLIPNAQAALSTTRADFSVGRADFASLFDAEVALLDLERARIRAAIQTHLQDAEMRALIGTQPPTGAPQ